MAARNLRCQMNVCVWWWIRLTWNAPPELLRVLWHVCGLVDSCQWKQQKKAELWLSQQLFGGSGSCRSGECTFSKYLSVWSLCEQSAQPDYRATSLKQDSFSEEFGISLFNLIEKCHFKLIVMQFMSVSVHLLPCVSCEWVSYLLWQSVCCSAASFTFQWL